MNIVDSSCWLEYLSGSATGDVVAPFIEETNKLPMADALIYATARLENCTLWTQDAHFESLEGVHYLPKYN